MNSSVPRHLIPHRLLTGGTVLALLTCPLLASSPQTWPGLVALVFVSSAGVVLLWQRDPLTTEQVLWGAVLLRIAFLPLLPGLTDDLYRYVWDGWMQVEGINPYRYAPNADALSAFQEAPVYEALNSKPYYSVYPPLSQFIFLLGGWLYAQLGWHAAYFGLKALLAAAEFCGVLLLSRLTTRRNLLLYAWNPLVLVETAGQGHTDALLLPLLLGGIWAVQQGKGRMASLAVAGAGLVKIYPFVLGPLLVRRFGWRAVWPGALLVATVSLPYAAPYTLPHLKASVDLFAQLFEFNAGPYYLTKYGFWLATGADWSKQIGPAFRYLLLGSLPVFYLLDWWHEWSIRWATLCIVGAFLTLSTTVHPWYLLPMLGLGVLYETPSWAWYWLGTFSMGTYLFYVDGPYWIWIIVGWGGAVVLAIVTDRSVLQSWYRKGGQPSSAPVGGGPEA